MTCIYSLSVCNNDIYNNIYDIHNDIYNDMYIQLVCMY